MVELPPSASTGQPPAPVILHWLQDQPRQNLGDFLSVLLVERALLQATAAANAYRLIGSVIHAAALANDLREARAPGGQVAYWGCGMRDDTPLAPQALAQARFYGVRGPLTRDRLGLPRETVLGDTGFLVPLLHTLARTPVSDGKSICVPHFHDAREDALLRHACGADLVLRPWVDNSLVALEEAINVIASASFVLTASLHAAVLACAYHVPFAFWENGFMDLPFKWRDLAASLAVPPCFVDRVADGRLLYHQILRLRLQRPALLPILAGAPFAVRPEILAAARRHDG